MLRITLDVSPLGHALRALDDNLDDAMAEALRESGVMVASEARTHHEFTDRTGALTRSIHSEPVEGTFLGNDLSVQVVADTPYAKFVEEGTRAHPIEARRAKVLRYHQNGRLMFRKRVRHPGTRPYRYLQGALDRLFPTAVTQRVEQGLVQAFKQSGFEVA
jgi:hypothetical protein